MVDPGLLAAALPGYAVGDEIGRGGWGIVFRARQLSLGRTVAIKQLPEAFTGNRAALDRFTEEARVVSRLEHPHVVDVYDFVEYQGNGFIIMEFVSGGSVWDQFARTGFDSDDACVIGLAVASALHAAHRQRIIHRDVKPDNVLLTQAGDVRLTDFGNMAGIGFGRAHTTDLIGTPAYMSPEQITGDPLTPASDIYGLGVMLHELLCGSLPFEPTIDRDELLDQRFNQRPADLPDWIPSSVRSVVSHALDRDPDKRFTSAESFGVSLATGANEWFGTDWLRHARGDLLDSSRIAAATRVSGMVPPAGTSRLIVAGAIESHARTGTVVEAQPGREQPSAGRAPETIAGDVAPTAPPTAAPPMAPPAEPATALPAPLPSDPSTDPTLDQTVDATDVISVTPSSTSMTDDPGPPPGTQPPIETSAPQTSRVGANKLLIAGVLGAGLVLLLVVAAVLVSVSGGGGSASAEYCAASAELEAELGQPGLNVDELRVLIDRGGQLAPADIVGSWQQLDQAVVDLQAEGAVALADEATADIFRYSTEQCG